MTFTSSLLTVSSTVAIATGEDGYLAYDLASGKLHRLNAGAALIIELCAGDKSADDLREILTPVLGDKIDPALTWITIALHEGFLKHVTTMPVSEATPVPQDFVGKRSINNTIASYPIGLLMDRLH